MFSKRNRNRLLIFLGLITIAISKSHNQRFEHGFESSRTSASKPSANSRQTDSDKDLLHTTAANYRGYLSEFVSTDHRPTDTVTKAKSERDYDLWPDHERKEGSSSQSQLSNRSGRVHEDSIDVSTKIDPQDFYFEPQKVKEHSTTLSSPSKKVLSRRTGILIADTANPAPPKKDEDKKVSSQKDVENVKKSSEISKPEIGDTENVKKSKPKRKKVLRVRVRGQNNKTFSSSHKDVIKIVKEVKLTDDTTTTQKSKQPLIQKPKLRTSEEPNIGGTTQKPKLRTIEKPKILLHTENPSAVRTTQYESNRTTQKSDTDLSTQKPEITRTTKEPGTIRNAQKSDFSRIIQEPKIRSTEKPTIIRSTEKSSTSGTTQKPKHRTTETPKHRTTETPKYRTTETPKQRTTETPKHRTTETAKHRTTEKPKHRSTEKPITLRTSNKPKIVRTTPKLRTVQRTKKPTIAQETEKPTNVRTPENPTMVRTTEKPHNIQTSEKPYIIRTAEKTTTTRTTEKPYVIRTSEKPYIIRSTEKPYISQTIKPSIIHSAKNPSIIQTTKNPRVVPTTKQPSLPRTTENSDLIQNLENIDISRTFQKSTIQITQPPKNNAIQIPYAPSTQQYKILTTPKPEVSTSQKHKYSSEIKIPPAVINLKDSNADLKFSKIPQKKNFQPHKKAKLPEKKKNPSSKVNKSDKSEKKEPLVTFYRRSGQKIMSKPGTQEPDWISMYKTENQNKDDNYYVLSFSYMGDKHNLFQYKPPQSEILIPQTRSKNVPENHHLKNPSVGKYPTGELNIEHLENVAGKFLEKKRKVANTDTVHKTHTEHYYPQDDTQPQQFDDGYYNTKSDISHNLPEKKKSFLENHPPAPTITLKRKKAKKQKEPVWKLQSQKKKFPDDHRKQIRPIMKPEQPNNLNYEDIERKPNTYPENHHVRNYMKQSLKAHAAFPTVNVKDENVQRQPVRVPEIKGDGNYYMHMYQKMGNIESIQNKENPDKMGYLSSLKLSWTDDDTRARVEEAVDSRALLAKGDYAYSAESIGSIEDDSRYTLASQPSENLMQYKSYYVNDFLSPLKNDKTSYYDHNIPITYRHKRSANETTRVTTHFKIGDSKVENNYTLNHRPKARFFSKRMGLFVNNKANISSQTASPVRIHFGNVAQQRNLEENKQNPSNIQSYYLKPNESREVTNLKSALNITDIFNKYEKPSREKTNMHIFHSYQTPNRHPNKNSHPEHNMTYFHRDKNSKVQLQITERESTRKIQIPQRTSNSTRIANISALNNFKSSAEKRISQSTDVKESFMKPENETTISVVNQTDINKEISDNNITLYQSIEKDKPNIHSTFDKTTKKPKSSYKTTSRPKSVIQSRTDKTTAKYNSVIHTRSGKTTVRPAAVIQSRADKTATESTQKPFVQSRTNKTATRSTPAIRSKTDKTVTKSARKAVIQSRAGKTTAKPIIIVPQKTTIKPATSTVQLVHKTGDLHSQINHGPQSITSTRARQFDEVSWHPKHHLENENEELYDEIKPHLDNDAIRTEQVNGQELHFKTNNDYEESLNGVEPQVSFKWREPRLLQQSFEGKYPMYHSVPKTQFTCKGRAPGYYADPETECQAFHMCQGNGAKHSFLCPNTTIFNQRLLVCDWHSKVHCEITESFYEVNNLLYRYPSAQQKNHDVEAKKPWNFHQRQNPTKPNFYHSPNENYNRNNHKVAQTGKHSDENISDVPQFIVKHFRENIPNAEFGKPKSVTKSYSAVIEKPKSKSSSIHNGKSGKKYLNEYEDSLAQSPKSEEIVIPKKFSNNQRAIKNSWNIKDKTQTHKLSPAPELNYNHENRDHYIIPNEQKSRNTQSYQKSKVIIPLVNTDDSYYVSKLDEMKYLDDAHVAGRQNEKVIVINRNRLNPEYESSESRESIDTGTAPLHEPSTKSVPAMPRPDTTHPQYSNNKQNLLKSKLSEPLITKQNNEQSREAYSRNKDSRMNEASKYFYENNEAERNQKHDDPGVRIPQYIYPLPGITQNDDGSRKYNYGYRVEDPESVNLQKTPISTLIPPTLSPSYRIKEDSEAKQLPLDEKIKWRISEIKSGVEDIGIQVGKIMGNADNTFKNVRIFKLNPNNANGELEEIRLKPFKFERQSPANTQDSQPKHVKREELEIELIGDNPNNRKNSLTELQHNTQQNLVNKERSPYTYETDEDISRNYKQIPNQGPKTSYEKNIGQLRSYDQMIKLVSNNARTSVAPNTNNEPHTGGSLRDINTTPQKYFLTTEQMIVNDNTEKIIPSKNAFKETSNKNYEVKYVPFISDTTNPKLKDKHEMVSLPIYKNEKSDHFENIFIPKIIEKDSSNFMYPDKIKLQRLKDPYIRSKAVNLEKLEFLDAELNQNKKDKTHNSQNKQVNNGDLNKEFFKTQFETVPYNDRQIIHATNTPHIKQKEMRNFIVISKPVHNTDTHLNIQQNTGSNIYQGNNFKTDEIPHRTVITQNLKEELGPECDDSSVTNSNSYKTQKLELGKNGPLQDSLFSTTKEILNGRSTAELKPNNANQDESASKCRDNAKIQNSDFKNLDSEEIVHENVKSFKKPVPKIAFKELKRPKYTFTPGDAMPRFAAKNVHESIQFRNKPIKLFQLQRQARPAFMKPATAIPHAPVVSGNEGYRYPHHSQQMSRGLQPSSPHQGRRVVKPSGYTQRKEQPRPYNQGRQEYMPVIHKPGMKPMRPAVSPALNSRELPDHSKRNAHGKNSKYADIEKAAELSALLKVRSKTQPSQDKSFPAARTRPQGKMVKPQESDESVDTSANHSRHSRYAALEKEAELKAERMIKSKKQHKEQ